MLRHNRELDLKIFEAGPNCCEPYRDTTDFAGSNLSEVKHSKIRAAKPELVQEDSRSSEDSSPPGPTPYIHSCN